MPSDEKKKKKTLSKSKSKEKKKTKVKPVKEEKPAEPEPLPEIPIPNDLMTVEDKIFLNNRDIISLKKDNKELRLRLKDLNDRLTETLENLRLKAAQASKNRKEPTDPALIHLREMENAQNQIDLYIKERGFLQERLKEGGQLELIKNLGLECASLQEEEARKIQELKTLNTASKAIANQNRKFTENKAHISRMRAMTDEKSYAEKKIRKIREKNPSEIAMQEKQVDFMKNMNARYLQACESTNSEPKIELVYHENTGLYGVKNLVPPEDKPSTPFLLDHPDRVGDIESEEQFQQLKDKVELMYKGLRVDQRAYMIKHKKISMDTKASDKTITKLRSNLAEEDKLYEQLVDRIERINRDSTNRRKLAPIQEMKNIIDLKALEEGGSILIKAGLCEQELPGDKQALQENMKSKLVNMNIWVHLDDILGMQADYSPVYSSAQKVGTETIQGQSHRGVQKINLDLSSVPIKKIESYFGTETGRLYSIEFSFRNGRSEKFGNVPEEPEETIESSRVSVPPYDYIRFVIFYGYPVYREVEKRSASPNASLRQSQQLTDSRAKESLVDSKIDDGIAKVFERFDFTGFAFDIIP